MTPKRSPRCLAVTRALTLEERRAAQTLCLWHPTEALTVYWACPDRGEYAWGWGVAADGPVSIDGWENLSGKVSGPRFGGWAFDAARAWEGFPSERWVVPRVLVTLRGEQAWAVGFGPGSTVELEQLRDAVTIVSAPVGSARALVIEQGDRRAWGALVEKVLSAINAGELDKAVAARVVNVRAAEPWEALSVLARLQQRFANCRAFLWRGANGAVFVGASPETLCRVQDGVLETEALAGSASGPAAEARLLESAKDLQEHQWVVAHLRQTLSGLCTAIEVDAKPSLRKLANITHLRTGVRGTLRAEVTAMQAARALHPTPAVAGAPRGAAMELLRGHEGFARGWYTGALGYSDEHSLELCVALRSALILGRTASVFVGAGVVRGSTAEAEWQETETKAGAMLDALGHRSVTDGLESEPTSPLTARSDDRVGSAAQHFSSDKASRPEGETNARRPAGNRPQGVVP